MSIPVGTGYFVLRHAVPGLAPLQLGSRKWWWPTSFWTGSICANLLSASICAILLPQAGSFSLFSVIAISCMTCVPLSPSIHSCSLPLMVNLSNAGVMWDSNPVATWCNCNVVHQHCLYISPLFNITTSKTNRRELKKREAQEGGIRNGARRKWPSKAQNGRHMVSHHGIQS